MIWVKENDAKIYRRIHKWGIFLRKFHRPLMRWGACLLRLECIQGLVLGPVGCEQTQVPSTYDPIRRWDGPVIMNMLDTSKGRRKCYLGSFYRILDFSTTAPIRTRYSASRPLESAPPVSQIVHLNHRQQSLGTSSLTLHIIKPSTDAVPTTAKAK